MIISFSKDLQGRESGFEEKIGDPGLFQPKVHTIRSLTYHKDGSSSRRYEPGQRIHFWMGNPRNRHTCSWMKPFSPAWGNCYRWIDSKGNPALRPGSDSYRPELGKDHPKPVIYATEDIRFDWKTTDDRKVFLIWIGKSLMITGFLVDTGEWRSSHMGTLNYLSMNDGFFHTTDFLKYFIGGSESGIFIGQIVHWRKGYCYDKENAETLEE